MSPAFRLLKERLQRLARLVGYLGLIAGGVALVVWLGFEVKSFLTSSAYFEVQTIDIQGVGPAVETKIRERLKAGGEAMNLLKISPEDLRADLSALPEIREVQVRKRLPDSLLVTASERFPAAVFVGELNYLVDNEMVVMGVIDGAAFLENSLPILTADPEPPIQLGKRLEYPGLQRSWSLIREIRRNAPEPAAKLAETHCDSRGETTLYFEGGTEICVGSRPAALALPVLEAFWQETDGFDGIQYADMKYRNQVAFRRRLEPTTRIEPASSRLPEDN